MRWWSMVEKVRRKLRDLPIGEPDPLVIQIALDREILPMLRELRQRFNELFDLVELGSVLTAVAEPELPGSRVLSEGVGIGFNDNGGSLAVSALIAAGVGVAVAEGGPGIATTISTLLSVVEIADSTLTMDLSHRGKLLLYTNGAGCTVTVPAVFAASDIVYHLQGAAGQVAFSGSGVTVKPPASFDPITAELNAPAVTLFTSPSVCYLSGQLEVA
jgi:hypothetical protein